MEYESIITEAEEMIVSYHFIIELLHSSEPLNEVVKVSNEFVLKELEGMKKEVEITLSDAKKRQKKDWEAQEAKHKLYYNVVCPHCGTKAQLKPEQEVKQPDYLMYFLFQCRKCKKDFMPDKPNNDGDLMVWYKNLIEDIENPYKVIIRNGQIKEYKDSEVKNFKRLQADLVKKVNHSNHLHMEVQDATVALMNMIQDANKWCVIVIKELKDGTNIYGLIPKKFSFDFGNVIETEQVLIGLIETVKKRIQNPAEMPLKDGTSAETMEEEIQKIQELLQERMGNREKFLLREEEIMKLNWNEDIACQCMKCKTEFTSKPCGEGSNEEGFLFFMFECPECKDRFADQIPNNPVDHKNFHQHILETKFGTEELAQKNYEIMGTTPERVLEGREQLKVLQQKANDFNKFKEEVTESIAIHDRWLAEKIEFLKH